MVLIAIQVVEGAWDRSRSSGRVPHHLRVERGHRRVRRPRPDLGTLFTSVVSLILAVPIGIAIGLFLSELAPGYLRTPIGMLVELLAAIPSVILGLWGIIVMGPFIAQHIEPWMIDHLGFIPLFSGYPSPSGLLPAC